MNLLSVIRASAGSGKTHFLTGFYLKILMREPIDYFKQILAVTFTNKATGEMKRRIIDELYKLSKGNHSNHLNLLISYTGKPENIIREKSAKLLENILHDYSWFSVETIDSFFQRIIRGFTHEIGIPGNYSIEIDSQPVIEFAVDTLIDNVHEKDDLLNWLVQYTEEKTALGKSWDIREGLMNLGPEIFKEKFSENSEVLIHVVSDKKEMTRFRNELAGYKKSTENQFIALGSKGIDIISKNKFNDEDFYLKSNGVRKFFFRIKKAELKNSAGELITHSALVQKLLEDASNWPSGISSRKEEVIAIARKELLPLLIEIVNLIESTYKAYYSVLEISKNIFAVGILAELAEGIREYRLERNAFILSDSPVLINRIINRNDAPFIYEKMGNRYSHYLIDEFQDTSVLQWKNFKPLISNSLSYGNPNLLVGDPKQSIYRWRNSNWEILAHYINHEYPEDVLHFEVLDKNYRSGEKIIQFNNALFPRAASTIKNQLSSYYAESENHSQEIDLLDAIFSDVEQQFAARNSGKGNVFVKFFLKENTNESANYYHELLVDKLNELLRNSYSLRDIAILVRDKKEGQEITNLLIEMNGQNRFVGDLSVLSEESLFLNVSDAVNLIIAAMQYMNNPSDAIVCAKLISTYKIINQDTHLIKDILLKGNSLNPAQIEKTLPPEFCLKINELSSLPLYDLAENLIYLFKLHESLPDLPFIHAFLDLIHEYIHSNPADLGRFLEYWEETGCTKAVPASESQNAIRVITIHKAKGLEFRAVIIPFCDWKLDQLPGTIFWADSRKTNFKLLPVVPLPYHKGLSDTQFAEEYFSELFKSYVDNLNLLYVALTRAIDSLIVFPVYNASDKNGAKIITVGDLMYESIVHASGNLLLSNFDPETKVFELKSELPIISGEDQPAVLDEYFECGKGSPAFERILFRAKGIEYFQNLDTPTLKGNVRGSVLHTILATIETHSELNKAIKQAALEGFITGHEGQELREHILECFNLGIVFSWFNGSGKVLTEKDILLPDGEVKRPDRIVIFPDKVHVIDYKFGGEKFIDLHRNQVKEYISHIEQMGYSQVEGFLWYIDQNRVIIA